MNATIFKLSVKYEVHLSVQLLYNLVLQAKNTNANTENGIPMPLVVQQNPVQWTRLEQIDKSGIAHFQEKSFYEKDAH